MGTIFLHSSFRSGSTYVWSKFRELPSTTAYYEPFHESLGLDIQRLLSLTGDSWNSHHPALNAPYFSEYRPFIEDNRVRNFASDFSYRRFFLGADAVQPGLQNYVGMLIDHAASLGKTPVFGFSRSLGRIGWLKAHFNSFNVLVLRRPRKQWASIVQQATTYGHPYFYTTNFVICGQNRNHPLVRPLIDVYDIPLIETADASRDIASYERVLSGVTNEVGYFIFFYHYLTTLIESGPAADLILDMDRLSADTGYRSEVTARIQDCTGETIDVSDADINRYRVRPPDIDYPSIERKVIAVITEGLGLSPDHPVLKAFQPAAGAALRSPAARSAPAAATRPATWPATWYDQQLAVLQTRLAQRDGEIAGLTTQLDQIRASTSWRITEPLRYATDFVRRVTASGSGALQSRWGSEFPRALSKTTGFGPTTAHPDDHAYAASPLHPRKCPP
jgi:hypothetical protein